MGVFNNFTAALSETVIDIYPDLSNKKEDIAIALDEEETKFRKTLQRGLKKIRPKLKELSGKELFDLYQTYGFPLELSLEIARENYVLVRESAIEDFKREFAAHQDISRKGSGHFKGGLGDQSTETIRLHTACHLLHAALRKILGNYVEQKGSNINAERLRFDFSHPEKLTPEQIKKIEELVNEQIKKDLPVEMTEMDLGEAKKSGALGFFEHKYGNEVKVYSIGDFSKEICGGPHVARTGELSRFKITKEESASAGIRRVKAVLVA